MDFVSNINPIETASSLTLTEEDLEKFASDKLADGLKSTAVSKYRSHLQHLCNWLPKGAVLTRELLLAWQTEIETAGYSQFTVEKYVTSVNIYTKYRGRPDLNIKKSRVYDIHGNTTSCGGLRRKYPDCVPGMKFGRLTLLEEAPRKNGCKYWLCKCDCGSECVAQEHHLKTGHTKSCGCLSRKYPDCVPGMKFGRLTLLEEAPRKNGVKYWYCKCDCGNECVVLESHLKSGHTKSCGCITVKRGTDHAIDISGKRFGRLVAIEPTTKRNKGSVVWKCQCDCGNIAYCGTEDLNRGKVRSCGCLREDQRKVNMEKHIHFVDGTCIEKIACQKEIATNTSGHRGVWKRENNRWRAGLTFRGKRYNLGSFDTFEEAVEARLKGEEMIAAFLEDYYGKPKEYIGIDHR